MSIFLTGLFLIAVVSWFVAAPFLSPPRRERQPTAEPERNLRQKQKDEALSAIKDAEFDFALGKLSEADYREMRRKLEAQVLRSIAALEGRADGHA